LRIEVAYEASYGCTFLGVDVRIVISASSPALASRFDHFGDRL